MLPLRSAPSAGRLCCCFHDSVLGLLLSLHVNPSLLFSASSVIQGLWLLASSGALRYFLQTHYYDGGVSMQNSKWGACRERMFWLGWFVLCLQTSLCVAVVMWSGELNHSRHWPRYLQSLPLHEHSMFHGADKFWRTERWGMRTILHTEASEGILKAKQRVHVSTENHMEGFREYKKPLKIKEILWRTPFSLCQHSGTQSFLYLSALFW